MIDDEYADRIETKVGNQSFRATGIIAYLKNGGMLEKAAAMANYASMRTTQLYDRRRDEPDHHVENGAASGLGDQLPFAPRFWTRQTPIHRGPEAN